MNEACTGNTAKLVDRLLNASGWVSGSFPDCGSVKPMSVSMRLIAFVLAVALLISGSALAAVNFEFDYRYDTRGFFDDPLRREALEAAGRVVNRYVDDLDAIIPEGSNGWASYFSPPNHTNAIILKDLPVQADTMQIFVAGVRSSGGWLSRLIRHPSARRSPTEIRHGRTPLPIVVSWGLRAIRQPTSAPWAARSVLIAT